MKTVLLILALFACASASAMDIDKDIFQTTVLGADMQPMATSGVSDLLLDPAFGTRFFDFNDANGKVDAALRIFPASGGGYWLAGYHVGTAPKVSLVIAKLTASGALDSSYGSSGKNVIASTMENVTDVAKGTGDTLYFVGTQHTGSFTDLDIQVACIDNTGVACSTFGSGGIKSVALDLGADAQNKDDSPARIVWFASQLYIVGATDTGAGTAKDKAAFAINLNPSSGALNTSFGNVTGHPGVFTYNPNHIANGRDVAYDVLAYSPSPFAYRLVIVGEKQLATAGGEDTDGFAISVNGVSGALDNLIDRSVFADLGTKRKDSLNRVMRRRNGGFVVAGTAQDDSASPVATNLLLAAFNADGSYDSAFGTQHSLVLSGTAFPYGLAERADTRDLIVGVNIKDDVFGDGHPMQAIVQYGRMGTPYLYHATATVDFPAQSDAQKASRGTDLLLDGSNRVVSAGYRCWTSTDILGIRLCTDGDMTSARFIATDTIFADAFGGSTSD